MIDVSQIDYSVFDHPEFRRYQQGITARFETWQADNRPRLIDLEVGSPPKPLIASLAADLLEIFAPARLIDKYDVYQHLMRYRTETMQDDVYMIVVDGWDSAGRLRLVTAQNGKEKPDLTIGRIKYKADLVPPDLIVARFFAQEKAAIDAMQAQAENLAGQLDELQEEQGGEEGLLVEVINDKGNITKGALNSRIKELTADGGRPTADDQEEFDLLQQYLGLMDELAETNKRIKAAQKELDEKVVKQYQQLTGDEIKTLVVDDKWLAALAAAVQGELERVSQALSGRITELAQRYAAPLPQLAQDVDNLAGKVAAHLEKMGFV